MQTSSGSTITNFGHDLAGHSILQYQGSVSQRFEVYAGGRHLVTYSHGLTYFDFPDLVGGEGVQETFSYFGKSGKIPA